MEKEQPNQKETPVIETESIEPIQEEKKEPVIETETLVGFSNLVKTDEVISKTVPIADAPNRPENDRKLSHEKRILAYIESRHTGDFIKLNDFLKSLYPLPKLNEKPSWQHQGAMRKLRQDLMAMRDRGEIVFSNTNPERLGDNYHVGEERRRKDYNIGDLIIEAKLAY
jgi:hypothetical protein